MRIASAVGKAEALERYKGSLRRLRTGVICGNGILHPKSVELGKNTIAIADFHSCKISVRTPISFTHKRQSLYDGLDGHMPCRVDCY
jgi:hypothetical protein